VMLPGLPMRFWNIFMRFARLMPSLAYGASASAISLGWILSGPLDGPGAGLVGWFARVSAG
jgi:hypothetical protein